MVNDSAEDTACLENYALRAAVALYPSIPASSMYIVFGRSDPGFTGEWRCGIVTRHGAGEAAAALRLLEASSIEFKAEKTKGKFEEDYKEKTWLFRRILLRNLVTLLERKTYLRVLKKPSEGEKAMVSAADRAGSSSFSAPIPVQPGQAPPPPYDAKGAEVALKDTKEG